MPTSPQKTQIALTFGDAGEPKTMSSVEIAALTGKELSHVHRDIRAMLEALKDDPNVDHPREDKDARGYTTAFHLNRELTDTLLTGYSIPLRRKVIARWRELEAQAAAPAFQIPTTLSGALMLAARQAEQIEQQQSALALAAPKAQALDRIAQAEGDMCITNAAKSLGMQPKRLFSWMQENDWIYRRPGSAAWLAYQARIKSGVLDHKVTTVSRADGREKVVEQVLVTPKGLAKLAEVAA